MDFTTIASFASTSVTTSSTTANRPFTLAFCLTLFAYLIKVSQAAVARAEESIFNPGLSHIQGLHLPTWMLSEVFLITLGVLMIAEWYIDQDPDLRPVFEDMKTNLVKPGVNAAMQFGLIQGNGTFILGALAQQLSPESLQWLVAVGPGVAVASNNALDLHAQVGLVESLGWVLIIIGVVWAGITSVGTWLIASLRQTVMDTLIDFDEDDSLGLLRLLSFAEGGWTITMALVVIFLPLIALAITALTLLGLFLIRRWFERRAERTKVPCAHCQTPIFPTALFCPQCHQANEHPLQVGIFGQARHTPALDRTAHRLQLIGRKRCPVCAAHLPAKSIRQRCPSCHTVTFNDLSEANVFLRSLDQKLPLTLIICGVLGFVPLLGLVPGIIYYRMSLIASLRAYIPTSIGCFTRWGLRFAAMFLIMLQPFFLGWLTLPAMALMNYFVYRRVLQSMMGGLPQPVMAASAPAGMYTAMAGGASSAPIPVSLPPVPLPEVTQPMHLAGTDPRMAHNPSPPQRSCVACGEANPATYRFCTSCGATMEVDPPEPDV
ncbi:zinc ribbon domain-containing protein [Candidatus Chloroploca sp. M-50]|uniref:Zinc ribbon domain-containing protein n=1 Tax=Candidatus Chloroploca mongolica TaxID=2528176 RepID=A0ABS4DGR8_9CHLR|nr:zinc ribbon domain-containing protein [Candidatus Chloroploca mongolica]MBP1468641.1 zinc ribbon domain-containing protein [Candidatus Chloroploca mongolica]